MELKTQIIIVDDDFEYAEQNAAFIETKCRIGCLPFGASDNDLKKLKTAILENPIKIIILDQRLNDDRSLLGTDIMPSLKELNPNLQFIMLTAQALSDDIFKAKALGYADFIHKSEWKNKMSDIIYKYFSKYDNQIKSINKVLKRGLKQTWILLDQQVINEEYVDEKKWISSDRIDRGKETEKTVEVELSISNELIITSESTIDFSLKAKVKSLFEKSITAKETRGLKGTFQMSKKMHITTKEKLSLNQNEKFEEKDVIAKVYQENQLYQQVLLHIAITCRLCKHEEIIPVFVLIPLPKKTYRQVIFTDDNKEHYVNTGIMDI